MLRSIFIHSGRADGQVRTGRAELRHRGDQPVLDRRLDAHVGEYSQRRFTILCIRQLHPLFGRQTGRKGFRTQHKPGRNG